MSRENEAAVRRGYDALRRRDVHTVLELMHPEVRATSRVAAVEGAEYRGREGIRRMLEEILSVFPDWAPEVLRTRALGDAVVAEIRMGGRAVESGISLVELAWQVLEFQDGKVVGMHGYGTEAEALEALGRQE